MSLDALLEKYKQISLELNAVTKEIIMTDWRHLANRGERFLAMQSYRLEAEMSGCPIGPLEAFKHIDSFIKMLNFGKKILTNGVKEYRRFIMLHCDEHTCTHEEWKNKLLILNNELNNFLAFLETH